MPTPRVREIRLVPAGNLPVISTALVYALAWPVVGLNRRFGARCVFVTAEPSLTASCGAAVATSSIAMVTGATAECQAAEPAVALTSSAVANALHWASGGLVGFARGWNDAPKIAALGIVALAAAKVANPAAVGFVIVTIAMALGGVLAGRKVLQTLAEKLTPLPFPESLTASMTTALLVSAASWASLPVSTTHVATGAIVGAGLKHDPASVRWTKVTEIALSWLVTLPVAGALSAPTMWAVGSAGRH